MRQTKKLWIPFSEFLEIWQYTAPVRTRTLLSVSHTYAGQPLVYYQRLKCILGHLTMAEGYKSSLMSFSSPWISRLVPHSSACIYVSARSFYFKLMSVLLDTTQINRVYTVGHLLLCKREPLLPANSGCIFTVSNFLFCSSLGIWFKGPVYCDGNSQASSSVKPCLGKAVLWAKC